MKILHISAECYPMAKVGGLGDVVGALPKYQSLQGLQSAVIVPMHRTAFLNSHQWNVVFKGEIKLGDTNVNYTIIKEADNSLGFELFCLDIFGLLDRDQVYGYSDDSFRFLAFQIATLQWLRSLSHPPDLLHLHDHHTGLIPFMIKYCFDFSNLIHLKTVFTIHNAAYQGWMDMALKNHLPHFDSWKTGLLLWNHQINSLACAVKCADSVTTVSPNYLKELTIESYGLESLFQQEFHKCTGILNGIDEKVWSPETDEMIAKKYDVSHVESGKTSNKNNLCNEFGLRADLPLIVFIGRLVYEKAADLLPAALQKAFTHFPNRFSCFVLGNGNPSIEQELIAIKTEFQDCYHAQITYDEQLSHRLYAGADFLLMPSRTEPCGLNQMYAMRYGTMPIVRNIGGLKDTVVDLNNENGFGICFDHLSEDEIVNAIARVLDVYKAKKQLMAVRKSMMNINHSWHKSANEYLDIYHSIL